MSCESLATWVRAQRRPLVLWVATTGLLALVVALMEWGGVPGWDDAAHAYKVFLLRSGDSIFWDNYWYGGSYGAVTYGFVFYWLAERISGALIVILAAGTLPATFYLYVREQWDIDDIWPAWGLALVMAMYLAHGQDPFLLALALTMVGLALLARGRTLLAVVPVAVGVFSNPLGLLVVVPLLLTDFLVRPWVRRRLLLFVAVLSPALLVRLAIGFVFTEPGAYLNEVAPLMVFLGFAFAGMGLAGVNAVHRRRPFVLLFAVYATLCLVSFFLPGSPMGNNIGRFFMVFGLSLLLMLRHTRLRRTFRYGALAIVTIGVFSVLQLATPFGHFLADEERPQTTAAFFAPALAAASQLNQRDYRVHVVALRRHWEAFYFPAAGCPITRGWYRQADAIHNSFFYTEYGAAEYVGWLRRMGVAYVFAPRSAPLDPWSEREPQILASSPEFALVQQTADWRIYRLVGAEPLLVPHRETTGTGRIVSMGHQSVVVHVSAPGTYWLKVTSSPFWELSGGSGSVGPRADRFMDLRLPAAGTYRLRLVVTPAKMARAAARRLGV